MKLCWTVFLVAAALSACGGGGGGSAVGGSTAPATINAADYKLPSALPSVPDQAGKN